MDDRHGISAWKAGSYDSARATAGGGVGGRTNRLGRRRGVGGGGLGAAEETGHGADWEAAGAGKGDGKDSTTGRGARQLTGNGVGLRGAHSHGRGSKPAVKEAILDGLGKVVFLNLDGALEVGNRAGDPADLVIGAGAEA